MELSGKVIQILPKQTGEGKNGTWEKQEYVIETQGQYPKKVCFSIWGAKISTHNIQMGEFINIGLDLESREYNQRWYTEVRAWKVERPGQSQGAPMGGGDMGSMNATDPFATTGAVNDPFATSDSSDDDLPF
jgi:hypothetical protein